MKIKIISIFIFINFICLDLYASDEWRVFGPGYTIKSQYSLSPFCKWHKQAITYWIASSPEGLAYLIDRSFNTWEAVGLYDFSSVSSGNDIRIETVTNKEWFGYGPFTYNSSTGEITSALIQLNLGPTPSGHTLVWTDGTENVGEGDTWYLDVQNCVTHEIGHNLGIAHHSTGNGEPTMATRSQCPSFNTTLKRRTLEADDIGAFRFLVKNLYVTSEYSSINSAINAYSLGQTVHVSSGTYTENLSMQPGVSVTGAGTSSTTINGSVTFDYDDYASLSAVTVNNRISVNSSYGVSLSSIVAGSSSCYIDASNSSDITMSNITSTVSGSYAMYEHSGSYVFLVSASLTNKLDAVLLEGSSYGEYWWTYFCPSSYYDIYSYNSTAYAYACTFTGSTPGSTVSGDVYWDFWLSCGGG